MTTETLIPPTELLDSPFLQELVNQVRAVDTYGFYSTWSTERILEPFIVTKAQKKEISLEGGVDPKTLSRIQWFFKAIAAVIERETGRMVQVSIDLNEEGFGWALVFSGRLLVVNRSLRDAQRFGFVTLEKLAQEGDKLIERGIELAKTYPDVCKL